jgi:dextranase
MSDVFVYTGPGGDDVPQAPRDVVRVRVDPSVTSIPAHEFRYRKKLIEVVLCEGLVEIGYNSFACCHNSIMKIIIPNSLRRINKSAFNFSLRCPIHLQDGIESIGEYAFAGCIFTNFRVPLLITVIPNGMLAGCKSTFSVEIPLTVTEIGYGAFSDCFCLQNVAFPPDAVIGNDVLNEPPTDLLQLFVSIAENTTTEASIQ